MIDRRSFLKFIGASTAAGAGAALLSDEAIASVDLADASVVVPADTNGRPPHQASNPPGEIYLMIGGNQYLLTRVSCLDHEFESYTPNDSLFVEYPGAGHGYTRVDLTVKGVHDIPCGPQEIQVIMPGGALSFRGFVQSFDYSYTFRSSRPMETNILVTLATNYT